jgi:hypothetical protein
LPNGNNVEPEGPDRAVTMSGNSKRGVGTDDRQPDVQVLDYKSRTGADEQFKLFSYEYRESLATPRIPPILVGKFRNFLDKLPHFQKSHTTRDRVTISRPFCII